jgi:5-(carboxyamino)imidazole ribonucleotide mutase
VKSNTTKKSIANKNKSPIISIIMGSESDYSTMSYAVKILQDFKVSFEVKIISAHRTPKRLFEFAENAKKRGIKIIIAGAGGAAHLPGMVASITILPVLAVPIQSKVLQGVDSLLSIVQMPAGIPVGCLAIGESGAKNASLLALQILAIEDSEIAKKILNFREEQTKNIKIEIDNL